MSTTFAKAKRNVRVLCKDTYQGDYANGDDLLTLVFNDRLGKFARRIGISETTELTESVVTTGDHDYEFYIVQSPAVEYEKIIQVQYLDAAGNRVDFNNRFTVDDINHLRAGVAGTQLGALEGYAIQLRRIATEAKERTYIWTWPSRVGNPDVTGWRIRVANWPTMLSADTDLIPFRDSVCRIFEKDCAASLISKMPESIKQNLKVANDAHTTLAAEVERDIDAELAQQGRPDRHDVVLRYER